MLNLKRKITNKILTYLWKSPVTEDEVLTSNGKNIMLYGEVLDVGAIQDLQSQARTLKNMALWQLLNKATVHGAQKKMFDEAKVPDDILFGKAILYSEDVRAKIIDNLLKIKV